jgi:hypothetical protein
MLGQGSRAARPEAPFPLPRGRPALAEALTDLLGIDADQPHERGLTAQPAGQGIAALHPKQGLHPVAQDLLDERDHRAMSSSAVGLVQQRHHPDGL